MSTVPTYPDVGVSCWDGIEIYIKNTIFWKKNFLAEVFEKYIKISFIIHEHTLKLEFIDFSPRQAFQHMVPTWLIDWMNNLYSTTTSRGWITSTTTTCTTITSRGWITSTTTTCTTSSSRGYSINPWFKSMLLFIYLVN